MKSGLDAVEYCTAAPPEHKVNNKLYNNIKTYKCLDFIRGPDNQYVLCRMSILQPCKSDNV